LDGKPRLLPRGHAAVKDREVLVAELLEGRGRERRPHAVDAGHRDRGCLRRHDVADPELEPAPGNPARARYLAAREFLARGDGDERRRRRRLKIARRDGPGGAARLRPSGGYLVRQALFERAAARRPRGDAAVDGEDIAESHLPVPRSDQRGARLLVAREDDRSVLHRGHVIGALDRLASGEPPEAGNVARGIFVGCPYLDAL